ncbi:MAG: hypothetical protein J7M24_04855 [Candidatus Latescibacteria bacterium]|nr:hypothetical protein [Candidatus Latescibacterota bacterium]
MKLAEIIMTTLWVVIAFFIAGFLVDHLDINGAFLRFVVRVAVIGASMLILYLFGELKSNARHIEELEQQLDGGDSGAEHASGDK